MEIERKWLINPNNIPYDLDSLEVLDIEQYYISIHPTIRARRVNVSNFILTIKTELKNIDSELARNEFETVLPSEIYYGLRESRKGNCIKKKRYLNHLPSGLTEEIDIFEGNLSGLAYLEIEFPEINQAVNYPDPDWVIKDVTRDNRYKNGALISLETPYKLIQTQK